MEDNEVRINSMGGKSITGANGPAKITPCTKHWVRIDQGQFSAVRRMKRDKR